MSADLNGECDDCHADGVPVWNYGALEEGAWQFCADCMTRRGWGDLVKDGS